MTGRLVTLLLAVLTAGTLLLATPASAPAAAGAGTSHFGGRGFGGGYRTYRPGYRSYRYGSRGYGRGFGHGFFIGHFFGFGVPIWPFLLLLFIIWISRRGRRR